MNSIFKAATAGIVGAWLIFPSAAQQLAPYTVLGNPTGTQAPARGVPFRYPTRAIAIAATIPAAATTLELDGYAALGDAPRALYYRVPCTAAVAWGFQSTDKIDSTGATCTGSNINWRLSGDTLDVRQLGAVCDANGTIDNTTVFTNIAAYIDATHVPTLNFPHGNLNCGIWPTGTTLPNQDALFDLTSPLGLTVNFNGSCIRSSANDTDWSGKINYVWFLRGANRVTINDLCYLQPSTTNPTSTFGAVGIQQTGAGHGLVINNGRQEGGLAGLIVSNTGTDVFNGTIINNFYFDGTYYPLSFQHGANDVFAVGLYSKNHGRFYFPRNSKNHFIRASLEWAGHNQPEGALIKVYCDSTETIEQNTTENIDLGLHFVVGSAAAVAVGVHLSFQQLNVANDCLNKGVIRNIKINLSGDLPDTTNNNVLVATSKRTEDFSVDGTARGYTVDNVVIGGSLTNRDTSSAGQNLISLFLSTDGSFSTETINNIVLRNLVITSANGTAANSIVIDGTSVKGLVMDNVSVRSQFSLTNIDLTQSVWQNIRTSSFSVNSVTTYSTILGGGVMEKAGEIALDGGNPTPVTTGLASILACTLTIKNTAAPALGTSVVTYGSSGGTLNMYGWKPTSAIDATLVASTGTETIGWKCSGS